jgi:hypothetical protein
LTFDVYSRVVVRLRHDNAEKIDAIIGGGSDSKSRSKARKINAAVAAKTGIIN